MEAKGSGGGGDKVATESTKQRDIEVEQKGYRVH